MIREYAYDIMPEIQKRYATKNFSSRPVSREALLPLVEAARYAPSCYNEQPWRYLLGDDPKTHEKLARCLVPGNAWAKEAPVLILALCTHAFRRNGRENPYSRFDTGTATGFLQLEAIHRGFAVHCMAGFDAELARKEFDIGEDLDVIAMLALGYPADLDALDLEKRKLESPGTRNPLKSLLLNP